jgi:hypothetical protein
MRPGPAKTRNSPTSGPIRVRCKKPAGMALPPATIIMPVSRNAPAGAGSRIAAGQAAPTGHHTGEADGGHHGSVTRRIRWACDRRSAPAWPSARPTPSRLARPTARKAPSCIEQVRSALSPAPIYNVVESAITGARPMGENGRAPALPCSLIGGRPVAASPWRQSIGMRSVWPGIRAGEAR